ncbi:hypothetical protein DUNSADRAFT_847 [Dunaliella salina]|uniref:KIF-binding protein n=1 Tax=Dunaliella salina TaxID=3046 RepID=A0ABQ7FYA8_DUNSA|nr:hypothetical protein DUNSADRAFT_847 [Dunaliella salina]|eukprot:KAF5827338.1 hypothetical protein DUNSADRAFT_847 [Dunaliella salina]
MSSTHVAELMRTRDSWLYAMAHCTRWVMAHEKAMDRCLAVQDYSALRAFTRLRDSYLEKLKGCERALDVLNGALRDADLPPSPASDLVDPACEGAFQWGGGILYTMKAAERRFVNFLSPMPNKEMRKVKEREKKVL